jgi:Ca2+:H+ antiporter
MRPRPGAGALWQVRQVRQVWPVVAPLAGVALLALTWGRALGGVLVAVVAAVLVVTVLAAVQHAEVVAHRVGEPFGSLLLAVAVTVIEVGLIVTLMSSGGDQAATLARDTVFAAVMITINGIVGVSLLIGSVRFGMAHFNAEGTGAALATVTSLATLCLVLPAFTTSSPGPQFSPAQLAFAAVASLLLYGMFVATQTGRHRDFFLPVAPPRQSSPGEHSGTAGAERVPEVDVHAEPPSTRAALASLALLFVALVAVVGLAKVQAAPIESAVSAAGLPLSVVGVVIALVILLPETLAAARAAWRGRIQVSLNLAFGSAMASIGLTVPAIAISSIWLSGPLLLGLGPTHMVLLALTILVSLLTVVPSRASRLQGGVHLVLLAAFLFLSTNP